MKYRFNVSMNDKDYLDFNIFSALKSPHGKAQMIKLRVLITVMVLVSIVANLISKNFKGIVSMAILGVAIQLLLNLIMTVSVKGVLKTMKKKGKMPYTPESVLEFYDDYFIEITPETKHEVNYSMVERINVVKGKAIYIHVNSIMAYIVPLSCFSKDEEFSNFVEFIRQRCENANLY